MLTNSRSSTRPTFAMDWLGAALLNFGFLRAGLTRGLSIEQLPDHLRRDIGLLPRLEGRTDPRDRHW